MKHGIKRRVMQGNYENVLRFAIVPLLIAALAGFVSWQLYATEGIREGSRAKGMIKATPNDGDRCSTFLLHIQPNWIFSEDYHLYYLRAKRMTVFGPVDNILEPSRSRSYDIRNVMQIVITLLPALFGEDIRIYAVIYALYIAVALFILYRSGVSTMSNEMAALLGMVVAIYMMDESRFFRISTTMLSLPLCIVVLSRLVRIEKGVQSSTPPVIDMILCLVLAFLAALDVWAYLFSMSVLFVYVVQLIINKAYRQVRPVVLAALPALVYIAVTTVLYASGDLSLRSGIGGAVLSDPRVIVKEIVTDFVFLSVLAASLAVLALDPGSVVRRPLVGVVLGFGGVVCLGYGLNIYYYQLNHFRLLFKPLAVWLIIVAVVRINRDRLAHIMRMGKLPELVGRAWVRVAAAAIVFGAVIVFATLALLPFTNSVAQHRQHYANPAKHERLLGYLRNSVQEQIGRTFLTLSPELNYYIAYHTAFDMLLPSGFPLHSRLSNEEISLRIAGIFRLLAIPPGSWEPLINAGMNHDIWMQSRIAAAQVNWQYEMFHFYVMHRDAYMATFAVVGNELISPTQPLLTPDYILIDEVATSLRARVPDQYQLIYADSDLRLYQRVVERPRHGRPAIGVETEYCSVST